MYSKVVVARVKRSSARPAGCPVAFRIKTSALGLDLNVPHTFVRALRLEIVGRHTQNFRRVATVKVGFRIGSTTLVRLEKQKRKWTATNRDASERRHCSETLTSGGKRQWNLHGQQCY